MNLYKLILDKNSHQVLECSKVPNDNKDGVDYIKSRGIFYYNFDNVIIDMNYDFDIQNNYDSSIISAINRGASTSPLQEEINRTIYINALTFIRNLKLEDLDI
jgi:hypothetical protein